ncbi:MAG: hypothetical protein HY902_01215 [Deltaproteobacteria bacterium]|nr:hypothetical protein [Deltaproteobacteria bacterium]
MASVAMGFAVAWAGAATARAARVHVRARSHLQLQAVARPNGAQVRGSLRDQRGDPIGGAAVAVHTVDGEGRGAPRSQLAVTAADGSFAVAVPGQEGATTSIHAEATYAGDASHGEAQAELLADLGKAAALVKVTLASSRWQLAGPAWSVTATARSDGEALPALPLALRIDGKQVLEMRTDASGTAQASLAVAALGGLGNHRASVELAPTDRLNGADDEVRFAVVDTVDVQLQVQAGREGQACGSDDWCLTGTARRHGEPKPHSNAAVTIYADKQIIGTLVTDELGRFAAVLRSEALERYAHAGKIEIAAQVAGGRPFVDDGWSPVLPLELPQGPAWREWLAAGAVAFLLIGAGLRALWRRRQERLLRRELEDSAAGLHGDAIVYGRQGALESRKLSGSVRHGETGRPVAAEIWLERGDQRVDVPCPQGHFALEAAPDGAWTLRLRAADHELLTAEVLVPHDGRYDGCTLQPTSCRAVVRGSLAEAVRKASGRGVDWGRETPRQVEPRWARHLRRGHLEVREAVRTSERALYGQRTDEKVVVDVKDALGRVEEAQK